MVGQDIFSAMKQFERSLPPSGIPRRDELSEAGQQMSFFSWVHESRGKTRSGSDDAGCH